VNGLVAVAIGAPIVLAAMLLPGAAWLLVGGPTNRSRAESVGTSLALSPGLYGGAIALLLGAGVSMRAATVAALAGFALVAAGAAWGRRRGGARAVAAPPPDARVAWVTAAVVTGLVALFPLLSEWWRIDSDAWSHFAITRAVVERGAHPLDPFFAGIPLQYPWIYHALMASVTTSTGASAFALMPLWSAIALASLLLCAGPIAARLHGRTQVWGLVLLLFGLNAAFPVFAPLLLAKAMAGVVRGWPEIARTFTLVPFGLPRVTTILTSLGGQDYFLNKFMVPTPFALGLAAYTAFSACLLRWLDNGDRRELWLAAGAMLAAGLMHPVVALGVGGATLSLAALSIITPTAIGISRDAAAALAGAVVAGLVPVVLYTSGILGGEGSSHREIPIDISQWKLLGLYSTLALGLLLSGSPVLALLRAAGPRRAWAIWIGLHLVIATVIRIPGPSSFFTVDKFAYFVWIPLALTAGAGLERLLARSHHADRNRGAALRARNRPRTPRKGLRSKRRRAAAVGHAGAEMDARKSASGRSPRRAVWRPGDLQPRGARPVHERRRTWAATRIPDE
jgi:hypothetical protein